MDCTVTPTGTAPRSFRPVRPRLHQLLSPLSSPPPPLHATQLAMWAALAAPAPLWATFATRATFAMQVRNSDLFAALLPVPMSRLAFVFLRSACVGTNVQACASRQRNHPQFTQLQPLPASSEVLAACALKVSAFKLFFEDSHPEMSLIHLP